MSMLPGEIGDTTVQKYYVPEIWGQNFPYSPAVGGALTKQQQKAGSNAINNILSSGDTQLGAFIPKAQKDVLRTKFGQVVDGPLNSWSVDQMMPAIQKYYGKEYADAVKQKIDSINEQQMYDAGRNREGFINQLQQNGNYGQSVQNALKGVYGNEGKVNLPSYAPSASLWEQISGQQSEPLNIPVLQASNGGK